MSVPIADRLELVQERIVQAARRRGRSPEDVQLVAVTKTVPVERISLAYDAGQRVFGENRVQEGAEKIAKLAPTMPGVRWHLIGRLQGNKARAAVQSFSLIESVDSVRLAERLNRLAQAEGERKPVLLEVNLAGEESKAGFRTDELMHAFPDLLALDALQLRGLMTVAPMVEDPEEVRPVFRHLREMRDTLRDRWKTEGLPDLSMGMSNDFEVAVEEGATMVRVGRALFGERLPPVRSR